MNLTPDSLLIIDWKPGSGIVLLDQRLLPAEERHVICSSVDELCNAIQNMTVRGAPALGVAAAMGVALAAQTASKNSWAEFRRDIETAARKIIATRPTAVNLSWGAERLLARLARCQELCFDMPLQDVTNLLIDEAIAVKNEDIATNKRIGNFGAELIADGDIILTHCNAGALCSAGFGTALGVIYAAVAQGKKIKVFADETRPLLQGSRLTAWELDRHGIDITVICDNMAAWTITQKKVSKIIVGADRIAANGDTANKIGTLGLAILAKHFSIPFYVAAPFSTIDTQTASGDKILIEERCESEIRQFSSSTITPRNANVFNPAFDVTPASLITAHITESGIIKFPFAENFARLRPL